MFLDFILRFRGSGPGGLLWTRGPHCSQSLHCLLTLCLSPPTLQPPVTSCRVSITGNHVFRATSPASVQKALEAARAEAGRPEGAGHCRWPSGLCRLSLPPTEAFGGQIPQCQPEGHMLGCAVFPCPSPAWVLLQLHLLTLGLGLDSVLSLRAQLPTPHGHFWVPASFAASQGPGPEPWGTE